MRSKLALAALLPVEEFPLPLRSALKDLPPGQFALPEEASAVFYNNVAFDPAAPLGGASVRAIAKYPGSALLRSGWIEGERFLAGRIAAAEVRMGKGRVLVYGFAVHMRAQPHGTLKLLFNGIHQAGTE